MIPNIVKGKGISGAIRYNLGQGRDKETKQWKSLIPGEPGRAEILGGQNLGFDVKDEATLELARKVMEWNGKEENQASKGRKCVKDCLHASLSWEPGQTPTKEQMVSAAKEFLKSIGMETAMAVFIAHDDTKHRHVHIVASRLNPRTGLAFSSTDDFSKAQAWALRYEREHGQSLQSDQRKATHKMADAVEQRNIRSILEQLTERNATFSARDVDRAVSKVIIDRKEKAAFCKQILSHSEVIPLKDGKATRYTVREVLLEERQALQAGRTLARDTTKAVPQRITDPIAERRTLTNEQSTALAHLTDKSGLSILWGQAGTGKSHTLNAVREAYQARNKRVIGLSWTNKVVQSMRDDGFGHAETVAAQLYALADKRETWDKDTVLILDEAAMVATKPLRQILQYAANAGAKLILAGDDKQLGSIERGGLFQALRLEHGAAKLNEIMRTKDPRQKVAFGLMHQGDFDTAIRIFDKDRRISWSEKGADALKAMATKYANAVAADPDKKRFMFAYTNAEVAALNDFARAIHKAAGRLGKDVLLKTAYGDQNFAVGDRIAIAGSAPGKKAKRAGLANGHVGTITAIEIKNTMPTVTVALDVAAGAKKKNVTFIVGEDEAAGQFNKIKLGYGGTIYKGQGQSLDEVLVCHSRLWRATSAYVALTRHRDRVHIFANKEVAKNITELAVYIARKEEKRAASLFEIDASNPLSMDFVDARRALDTGENASIRNYTPKQFAADAERHNARMGRGEGDKFDATRDGMEKSGERLTRRARDTETVDSKASREEAEAKKQMLGELMKIIGQEVTQQEGKEIRREAGGGISL